MNQNSMMNASVGSESQSTALAPRSSAAVMQPPVATPQIHREQPESFHEMYPVSFAIRAELFCVSAIKAAVYRPDGLQATRNRVKDAFYSQWGWHASKYETDAVHAAAEVDQLEQERARLLEEQKKTPPTRMIDRLTFPTGAALLGWVCLVIAFAAVTTLDVINAASYFRFQTQGWFTAILMVFHLAFVPIAAKCATSKLSSLSRGRVGWVQAALGSLAFIGFVSTMSLRANPPTSAEILEGVVSSATRWNSLLFVCQAVCGLVSAMSFWSGIVEMMAIKAKMITNPDAELLTSKISKLHSMLEEPRKRLAVARGNLQELQSSLDYWLQRAETIFMIHFERERRFEELVRATDNWQQI